MRMTNDPKFVQRVAEYSVAFLHQALGLLPTAEEFIGWVNTQPLSIRALLLRRGPAACWDGGSLSYQDYVLNQRGYSVHQYMAQQLSAGDYLRWEKLISPAAEL